MRESSIALSRREHLTNDTESYRVRMRITTVEVACAKKENVLFKKNTPPPPPPPPTYVCISIIFNFSWNHCHNFEKQKTKVIQRFFGGVGANKVYYGRCANGELENHEGGRTVMSDGVLRDAGRETRKQEKKGCDIRLCPFL